MTTPGLRPVPVDDGANTPGASVRARFLVTPVREPSDPADLPLPRPRPGSPPRAHWRLLSGNNRQLGRSPRSFPSGAEAEAATVALVVARETLDTVVVHLPAPVRWVWTASHDGEVVAISGRSYERERLAAGALAFFLEGLRDVALADRQSVSW